MIEAEKDSKRSAYLDIPRTGEPLLQHLDEVGYHAPGFGEDRSCQRYDGCDERVIGPYLVAMVEDAHAARRISFRTAGQDFADLVVTLEKRVSNRVLETAVGRPGDLVTDKRPQIELTLNRNRRLAEGFERFIRSATAFLYAAAALALVRGLAR